MSDELDCHNVSHHRCDYTTPQLDNSLADLDNLPDPDVPVEELAENL